MGLNKVDGPTPTGDSPQKVAFDMTRGKVKGPELMARTLLLTGVANKTLTAKSNAPETLGVTPKPSDPNGPRRRGHLQVQRSLLNRAYGRTKESLG